MAGYREGGRATLMPHQDCGLALAAYEAIKASHLITAVAVNLSSCLLCFQSGLTVFLFLRPQEHFQLIRNHSQP